MFYKKIAIDLRMHKRSGIGRCVLNTITMIKNMIPNDALYVILRHDNRKDGRFQHLKKIFINSDIFSLSEQVELPRVLKKYGIELLHSPQFNIPLFFSGKQVTTINDCSFDRFPEEFPSIKAKIYYKIFFPLALSKSDRIIAISQSTKTDLIKYHKISSDKVKVIYLGIDIDYFRSRLGNEKINQYIKKKYSLDVPFGLYVGLTRPRKNLINLLKAIKMLREKKNIDFKMVFVGKIDNRFLDIEYTARKLKINDIVIQTGFISDEEMITLYGMAAFFIFPSLYEGFGLPILEAMACGTPVIASNVSSIPEVTGDAALLINPYDVEEISQSMHELFTNIKFRKFLIDKGFERVNLFKWKKTVKDTLNIYKSILL